MFAVLLFISTAAFLSQRPPPSVDLATCELTHGFLIGEAPPFQGAVEILKCPSRTVATLVQMQGEWPNHTRVTRSRFSPEPGPGELLMGCRGEDDNFDGTVAIAAMAEGKPQVRLAWKANLTKWEFAPVSIAGLVCNPGRALNRHSV